MVSKYKEQQIGKKLDKTAKVVKRIRNVVLLIVLSYMIYSTMYFTSVAYDFTKSHTFNWRLPFVLRTPLVIEGKKPLKKPTVTPLRHVEKKKVEVPLKDEQAIAMSQKHGSILWNIFQLESQRGKNDECRRLGLGYNGLGLGESDEYIRLHGPNCFPSLEALWTRAERLIVDLGVDKNEARAICSWKYGDKFNQPSCNYYQSFLSL